MSIILPRASMVPLLGVLCLYLFISNNEILEHAQDTTLDRTSSWPFPTAQRLPTITDMHFFREQIRSNESLISINTTIQDSAAYLLPPGQYGGPKIPCVVDERTNATATKHSSPAWNYNSFAPIIEEDEVTVVFTFSARYCNPDLRLFQAVWNSHIQYMPLFASMRKVLVFDGFGDVGAVTNNKQIEKANIALTNNAALSLDRYLIFQDQIELFMQLQNQTRFSIQRMTINMGPVKALSQIMPTITTPTVYLAQDDFALNVNVDAKKVVRTMLNAAMGYNNVRYVLLAKYYRAKLPTSFYLQRGLSPNATARFTTNETAQVYPPDADQSRLQAYDYGSVCLDDHFTHKVGFFSDNNHFALTELYTKYLLPKNHQKGNKFVEDAHQSLAIHRPQDWGRYYGSHQYNVHEEVLIHLDGRDLKWCRR